MLTNIYESWSTSGFRVLLAPWNRLKPSSKIFYCPFQGSTSFVDLLCFYCLVFVMYFVRVCLFVPCGHLLGRDWPLGSRLWCITERLSLSHWYPGSGVVFDCIDSWSLHPYLLWLSELCCLCCVAAQKCFPALSFNDLIIPILRIVCTISFHYSCPWISSTSYNAHKITR